MKDLLDHLRLYDSAEFSVDEFMLDATETEETEEESSSSFNDHNNNNNNNSTRSSRSRSRSRRSLSRSSRRSTMSRSSSSWKDLYKRSLKIPIDEPPVVSHSKVTIHIQVVEDDDVGSSSRILTGRFYPTTTTIGELKEKLSMKVGIPPDQQLLTIILQKSNNNNEMMKKTKKNKKSLLSSTNINNTMTLFDANIIINNESILLLEVRRLWQ